MNVANKVTGVQPTALTERPMSQPYQDGCGWKRQQSGGVAGVCPDFVIRFTFHLICALFVIATSLSSCTSRRCSRRLQLRDTELIYHATVLYQVLYILPRSLLHAILTPNQITHSSATIKLEKSKTEFPWARHNAPGLLYHQGPCASLHCGKQSERLSWRRRWWTLLQGCFENRHVGVLTWRGSWHLRSQLYCTTSLPEMPG